MPWSEFPNVPSYPPHPQQVAVSVKCTRWQVMAFEAVFNDVMEFSLIRNSPPLRAAVGP